MEPLVSVVTPVYNASKYLAKTLDSILSQTYQNLEIILIDDCSTDNSLEIMYDYAKKDSRIQVFESEKNQGVASVRNRGIQAANGEYIALLDSDDIWVENKIERQLESIRNTDAQISFCSYSFIDENDNEILHPFVVPEKTDYKKFLYVNCFSCSTIFVDAKLFKEHLFKGSYYHEDYLLWMELLSINVKNVGITDVLAYYRQVSGSRSHNKINAAKERWKIYRQALGMNVFKSAYVMAGYIYYGFKKYRK